MANILKTIIENDKGELRRLEKMADKVLNYESQMAAMSDEELKAKTDEFKERYNKGESLDSLLYEAFAVVREAAKRVLGLFPYKVQVMGVLDEKGNLCIAKFPSRKDDYDTGLWEHFSHLLAQKAGIQAAQTRTLGGLGKYHTLLSRRFDRTDEAKRIHFASSMSLLGLKDGDNAQGGYGYLDIVDFILQGCCNVEKNLQELYRRVAFNICIGNSDDHFRNHGFLLTPKGWTLSPAYDMNPTLNEYQSLLINESSNKADINILLDSSESYMIKREEAEIIIQEVQAAVSQWESLATLLQIPAREMAMFKERFKLNL